MNQITIVVSPEDRFESVVYASKIDGISDHSKLFAWPITIQGRAIYGYEIRPIFEKPQEKA